jgi:hypothetical protein
MTDCNSLYADNFAGSPASNSNHLVSDICAPPPYDYYDRNKLWALKNLWLRCHKEHKKCNAGPVVTDKAPLTLNVISQDVVLPTRVIVTTPHATKAKCPSLLETNGMKGTFAALSHRWGDTMAARTTRKNFAQHKEFIPLDEKSQTFIDAISLCEKLGIDFLWIDSLCIIQHEPDDPLSIKTF